MEREREESSTSEMENEGKGEQENETRVEEIQTRSINLVSEVPKSELSLTQGHSQWTKLRAAVDSGATDAVMSLSMCEHVQVLPSAQSQRGVEFEVAN